MGNDVEAILFDMGGTLRKTTRHIPGEELPFILRIGQLIHADMDPQVLRAYS